MFALESARHGGGTDIHTKLGLWEPMWPIFNRPHVLIPIYHKEQNHYTLLECVTKHMNFKHYNPLKITGADQYHEIARMVVSKENNLFYLCYY